MDNEISFASEVKLESEDKEPLIATFLPERGMNLVSLRKGKVEVLDQATMPLFEQRFAGLGALIGPHFHHRNEQVIPPIENEALFPHIARVRASGSKEPFSHGIARYAPWVVEEKDGVSIRAVLTGDHTWNGVKLKDLEGQDFKMGYSAKLEPEGLRIHLFVNSETESVVGLHTYYALANGKGTVTARVQDHYVDKSEFKPLPKNWNFSPDHTLVYPLDQSTETDFGFHPYPDHLHADVLMECATHKVRVQYWCENEQNSFQLWHPKDATFVCIEPLSAHDPRKPKLTVSNLKILISIL